MEEEEKGTRKTTFDEQVGYNALKLSTTIIINTSSMDYQMIYLMFHTLQANHSCRGSDRNQRNEDILSRDSDDSIGDLEHYVRLVDYNSVYQNPEGTTTIFTVFLIVNSTLGSGLLNFPKTFDDAGGIIAASVVQVILLVFVMTSLMALAYASDQCGTDGAENIQVSISI